MKTSQQWLDEYAVSHQNITNVKIHTICVPAIFYSIIGMLMTIQIPFIKSLGIDNPLTTNFAVFVAIFILLFYARLSFKIFLRMFIFTIVCFIANYFMSLYLPLFYTSLIIFIIAWIGQFYGHKIEGKKPSFFKDLQFLLIGPIWVFEKMFK